MTDISDKGEGAMARRRRTYSRITQEALTLLGSQIRLARKQRRLSEAGLAERIGVARSTLQLIEKGDPRVEIGLAFEAASIVGVPLFQPEATTLAPQIERTQDKLLLLPHAVRERRKEVKDDF
ncbi:MAG: helix-turn-helix transcriptional regulator [Hyphomicrobiaceae bacterium]